MGGGRSAGGDVASDRELSKGRNSGDEPCGFRPAHLGRLQLQRRGTAGGRGGRRGGPVGRCSSLLLLAGNPDHGTGPVLDENHRARRSGREEGSGDHGRFP